MLAIATAALVMLKCEFTQMHMGVSIRLTLFARSQEEGFQAAKAAFKRFGELDDMMSDYQKQSELNRLCAGPPDVWTSVSPELFDVLHQGRRLSVLTAGAFDTTVGPVVRIWRQARKDGKMPSDVSRMGALARSGYDKLDLDPLARKVLLRTAGMQLDLGGIAKGYACDEAMAVLKNHHINSAMIEGGGDLVVSDPPPGTDGWKIGILGWKDVVVTLKNQAMSTSGDAEQYVDIDGKRYSHVVDPKTGLGLTNSRQATVIADMGWLTDGLATAFCVMEPSESERLAKKLGVKIWLKG